MRSLKIQAEGVLTTPDAAPVTTALFALEPNGLLLGTLRVIARHVANGAAKCWEITFIMRRNGNGVTIVHTVNPAAFGSAADLTAMTGVTIGLFTDSSGGVVSAGVNLTGLAGASVDWTVLIEGIELVP